MYKVNKIVLCFLIAMVLTLSCSCGETSSPGTHDNQITEKTSRTKLDSDIPWLESNHPEETDGFPDDEKNTIITGDSLSDEPEEDEENDTSSLIPMENFYSFGTFSGGTAWIGSIGHYYLVNTAGKAQLDIDGYAQCTNFENGYSHIAKDSKRILTIDTFGNITSDLTLCENEKIVMVNGGYVFTREYVADFDSSGFEYRIYDPDGIIVKEFYSDQVQYLRYVTKINVGVDTSERDYDYEGLYCSYVGNDCIRFHNNDITEFYFIKDDKTVSANDYYFPWGINKDMRFSDGYAYVGISKTGDERDYSAKLVFLKDTSELITITLPFDSRYTDIDISNISKGYCVFLVGYYIEEEDKEGANIVIIDLHNVTYDIISTEFDDRLGWKPEMCHKNIVISMTGKDKENYYAVVDINGRTIRSPQKGYYNAGNCVYNDDATPIFDLEEKGFPEGCLMTNHNDGIVLVSKSSWTKVEFARYADEDGNSLFDSVDVSSAKVVSLRDEQ